MQNNSNTGIYAPSVGLRDYQFADVADICDLRGEMDRAKEMRREEARALPGGWL